MKVDVGARVLIAFLAFALVGAHRAPFLATTYIFDWVLPIYILYCSTAANAINFDVKAAHLIRILIYLNLCLIPALALLIFSYDPAGGLIFIGQVVFCFNILPTFIYFLITRGHLRLFLSSIIFIIFLFSVAYFFVRFFSILDWQSVLRMSGLPATSFGERFTIGEFTPNEVCYYLILVLFFQAGLSDKPEPNTWSFIILATIMTAFLFTASKAVSVLLGIALFILFKVRLAVAVCVGFFVGFMVLSTPDMVERVLYELSVSSSSNSVRISMLSSWWNAAGDLFFSPAFQSVSNLAVIDPSVVSVHNVFLSALTNLGLPTFAMLLVGLFWVVVRVIRGRKWVILTLWMSLFFVWMVNPFLNARMLWVPFFLLVFASVFELTDLGSDRKADRPSTLRRVASTGS